MHFRIATSADVFANKTLVPFPEGPARHPQLEKIIGKGAMKALSDALAAAAFNGEFGEVRKEMAVGTTIIAVGTGKKPLLPEGARKWAALAVRHLRNEKGDRTAVLLSATKKTEHLVRAMTEGFLLGDYRFVKYQKDAREKRDRTTVGEIVFVVADKSASRAAESAVRAGERDARATMFARDLVNEPSSKMTPADLVRVAKEIVAPHPGHFTLRVCGERELHAMGAGGLLAVGRGSEEETHLVHLSYVPRRKPKARVAIVGKGITFDSGGLSLKTSDGMENMKIDMAGAAAVFAVMSALPELDLPIEVHGIAGLAENMPSGKAVKPGDVVETMSGKTIEIRNTDAEGRVTLADTLWYGSKLEPDYLLDLATLTGACMVALGQEVAGLFSNDARFSRAISQAAADAGELVWEMPLVDEYRPLMKSHVADLKNIGGGRYGGALNAAVFLEEFVGDTSWAHIDMAGPAWAERDTLPHQPLGATGFGVRTVLRWLEHLK